MERRLAVGVARVDVDTGGQRQRDGLERIPLGAERPRSLDVPHPGGQHHRGVAGVGRQPLVGPVRGQHPHRLHVGRLGGQHVRRRPAQVDPIVHERPAGAEDALVGPPLVHDRHRLGPRVRVGAARQQHPHQRQTVELGPVPSGGVDELVRHAALRRAGPHQVVQDAVAAPVARVRVGARLEQHRRRGVVADGHGHAQQAPGRGRAAGGLRGGVGQPHVHLGARLDEQTQRVAGILSHGEHQRRESAGRGYVDDGACLEQQAHDRNVVLRGGPHQGRLAAPGVYRVDVRPVRQQRPDRGNAAGARAGQDRRLSDRRQKRVRTRVQQLGNHGGAGVGAGERERGGSVPVDGVGIRAGGEQQLGQRSVVPVGGPVQRRGAVHLRGVDVYAVLLQQARDRGAVTLPRQLRQPGLGFVGLEPGAREQQQHEQ